MLLIARVWNWILKLCTSCLTGAGLYSLYAQYSSLLGLLFTLDWDFIETSIYRKWANFWHKIWDSDLVHWLNTTECWTLPPGWTKTFVKSNSVCICHPHDFKIWNSKKPYSCFSSQWTVSFKVSNVICGSERRSRISNVCLSVCQSVSQCHYALKLF